jgi:hypothetical protein
MTLEKIARPFVGIWFEFSSIGNESVCEPETMAARAVAG